MKQKVTILGATGSIGLNSLDVIAKNSDRFDVFAVSANKNSDKLYDICQKFFPKYAVMIDQSQAVALEKKLKSQQIPTEVLIGSEALNFIASHEQVAIVIAAIVGSAGLLSSLSAAKAAKKILLANKESLVMSGELFMQTVRENQAILLPVDSEHNAIFQSLPSNYHCGMTPKFFRKIILTASGGPFRDLDFDDLKTVTPKQAIAHPNWKMGAKISVDSASMMNKALEVIEAHWLFDVNPTAIDVVLHPQSCVHSMVEYIDGAVIAELGLPDMRTAIANCLAWPDRMESGVASLDFKKLLQLDFKAIDCKRFPCLSLAYAALQAGGLSSCILNAANEVSNAAFLAGQIRFTDIYRINALVLDHLSLPARNDLPHILEADRLAREMAQKECGILAGQA